MSRFFGDCVQCQTFAEGIPIADQFYCEDCKATLDLFADLNVTRCFSFAAVYDIATGKRLSIGASHVGTGCAERHAMWKLDDAANVPKSMVVSRIRRNKGRITFGMSKPCAQCILAMPFYNIQRICYSERGKDSFTWIDTSDLKNEYETCSRVIITL